MLTWGSPTPLWVPKATKATKVSVSHVLLLLIVPFQFLKLIPFTRKISSTILRAGLNLLSILINRNIADEGRRITYSNPGSVLL